MRIWQNFKIAYRALLHNKNRALLTTIGVTIGVAAVMMMLSVGSGAQEAVIAEIQSLGTNLLLVMPGSITTSGIQMGGLQAQTLTLEDAQAISSIDGVQDVVPSISRGAQVIAGDRNISTTVIGVSANYDRVMNSPVASGSFFSSTEVDTWDPVAVIGVTVAKKLFPDGQALGQTIKIVSGSRKLSFRVTGILESKGASGFFDQDNQVLIPITTAQKLLFGVNSLSSIGIEAVSPQKMDEIAAQINSLLRIRHNIPEGKDADFTIFSQKDVQGALSTVMNYFTIMLAGIAGISLLVGGIGIMNIMLVSVSERTREIGLRRAVGAKKSDITAQFILEAITLSLFGGILGIIFGYLGSALFASIVGWPAVITPTSILLGFLFSFAVGLFFGYYPARRAANLNPIDALRYE